MQMTTDRDDDPDPGLDLTGHRSSSAASSPRPGTPDPDPAGTAFRPAALRLRPRCGRRAAARRARAPRVPGPVPTSEPPRDVALSQVGTGGVAAPERDSRGSALVAPQRFFTRNLCAARRREHRRVLRSEPPRPARAVRPAGRLSRSRAGTSLLRGCSCAVPAGRRRASS